MQWRQGPLLKCHRLKQIFQLATPVYLSHISYAYIVHKNGGSQHTCFSKNKDMNIRQPNFVDPVYNFYASAFMRQLRKCGLIRLPPQYQFLNSTEAKLSARLKTDQRPIYRSYLTLAALASRICVETQILRIDVWAKWKSEIPQRRYFDSHEKTASLCCFFL